LNVMGPPCLILLSASLYALPAAKLTAAVHSGYYQRVQSKKYAVWLLTHFAAFCISRLPQTLTFDVHCLQLHCTARGQTGYVQ